MSHLNRLGTGIIIIGMGLGRHKGMNMHGMATLEIKPLTPIIPASFQVGQGWFVAFVNATRMQWVFDEVYGSCFKIERDIIDLGYETFAPVEKRWRVIRGKKQEVVSPLLGTYIFVRFDRSRDEWGDILNLAYVHDVLRNRDIPMRVPDSVIERLRGADRAGVFDYVSTKAPFGAGDNVEIEGGPWDGLIGKVKSASPRKRAKILLSALGTVDIDLCFLRKVS